MGGAKSMAGNGFWLWTNIKQTYCSGDDDNDDGESDFT